MYLTDKYRILCDIKMHIRLKCTWNILPDYMLGYNTSQQYKSSNTKIETITVNCMKIFKLNNTITALGCSIRLLITDLTKQKKLLVNYKIWNFKLFGQRRKRKKKRKSRKPSGLWQISKGNNISIMEILEEKEKRVESIFKAIMPYNFPNIGEKCTSILMRPNGTQIGLH